MCKSCIYLNKPNNNNPKNPCNTCIVWNVDGEKDYRNFKRLTTSTSRIDIRLTEQEKAIIQQKATELNMSMSTYMIFVAVNAKIEVKIEGG